VLVGKSKQNVYGFLSLETHLIFIVVERGSLRCANQTKTYELGQTVMFRLTERKSLLT
jgi:hypothetical protein